MKLLIPLCMLAGGTDTNTLPYDKVYFDNLTVKGCESKCIIVMNSLSSTLCSIWRNNHNDITGHGCIFDNGFISTIHDFSDALSTGASSTGEIKNMSLNALSLCIFDDGIIATIPDGTIAMEEK